jgi:hypothetical protein
MSLYDKIMHIYPDLKSIDFLTVISLVADDNGARIDKWTHPELPMPTEAQLAAAPDTAYVPIPDEVPMWAVRTILQNDGLFEQVETLVKTSNDNALKNIWEYGNYAVRSSSAINNLALALGLTQDQLNQMFIAAAALTV